MPSLTVNIVARGAPETDGGTSKFGHMWYSLTDDAGQSSSYGFSPDSSHDGRPIAPGEVNAHGPDAENYKAPYYYTRTVPITQQQYDAMRNFGENTAAGAANSKVTVKDLDGNDQSFTLHYNGLTNRCIDYVWKAMQVGGMNPSGFEGKLLPSSNKGAIDQALSKQVAAMNDGTAPGSAQADGGGGDGGPLQVISELNILMCTGCPTPQPLTVTSQPNVFCQDQLCGTIADCIPVANVPIFGPCLFTPAPPSPSGGPCIPKPVGTWQPGSAFTHYDGIPALRQTDILQCAMGGTISFTYAGQEILEVE